MQPPVGNILSELRVGELEAADEEDDGDAAVDDGVFRSDGSTAGRDVFLERPSALLYSYFESNGASQLTGEEVCKHAAEPKPNH